MSTEDDETFGKIVVVKPKLEFVVNLSKRFYMLCYRKILSYFMTMI